MNLFYQGHQASKHYFAGSQRVATKMEQRHEPDIHDDHDYYENEQYYYHPDHLGSSSYITNAKGKVYEHLEYFPFGETWAHEHYNTNTTPYKFTGKELDEETGLYYYGARYYDPRTSVWVSPDPILAKYMGGKPNGGVFNPSNLMMFSYTMNNPLNLIDPDGKDVASPVYFRMSKSSDISSQKGSYGIIGYLTYNYSTMKEFEAAKASGKLSKPIGKFEVSFDAFSDKMQTPERGKILGSKAKVAQLNDISKWNTKHSISITDIGKKNLDRLTVKTGDSTKTVDQARLHYGGPYGSEGCATSCDASYTGKNGGEDNFVSAVKAALPSLNDKNENTYIKLPSRDWFPKYYNNKR